MLEIIVFSILCATIVALAYFVDVYRLSAKSSRLAARRLHEALHDLEQRHHTLKEQLAPKNAAIQELSRLRDGIRDFFVMAYGFAPYDPAYAGTDENDKAVRKTVCELMDKLEVQDGESFDRFAVLCYRYIVSLESKIEELQGHLYAVPDWEVYSVPDPDVEE